MATSSSSAGEPIEELTLPMIYQLHAGKQLSPDERSRFELAWAEFEMSIGTIVPITSIDFNAITCYAFNLLGKKLPPEAHNGRLAAVQDILAYAAIQRPSSERVLARISRTIRLHCPTKAS